MAPSFQVEGVDIYVEGEGATILMIHGWPDTYRLWEPQVAHLKPQYRCVRFTLPGFEVSQAPRNTTLLEMTALIKRIVDAVSPSQPLTLMLHDWGCVFGYHFAATYPGCVQRVVGVDIGDANAPAYLKSLTGKAKLQIAFYQLWLACAAKIPLLGDGLTRFMATKIGCRVNPKLIGRQQNYPYVLQWTGGLDKTARFKPHCPMFYAYGRKKLFMFHSAKWLETIAALPGGEVAEFRTGHWVTVEDSAGFNEKVASWLART